jgi:hypothetical protein
MSERKHQAFWSCGSCGLPAGKIQDSLIVVLAQSKKDAEQKAQVEAEKMHRRLRTRRPEPASPCKNDFYVEVFGVRVKEQ